MSGGDRILVLDARILLRAVLGTAVRELVERYAFEVAMCTPAVCAGEVRDYLRSLGSARRWNPEVTSAAFEALMGLVRPMDARLYQHFEASARRCLGGTWAAAGEWPVVALALALQGDVWSEEEYVFGVDRASWTTDTVEAFLNRNPNRVNECSPVYGERAA